MSADKFRNRYAIGERLLLFAKYIISIFIGSNAMTEDVDLSKLALNAFPYHGGGGVLPNYGFFYLGVIGVILLALLVTRYFTVIAKTNSKSSGLCKCITVYILASMMKWYLYSPAPLLRGVLLLSVVYYCTNRFIHRHRRKVR